MLFSYNAYKQMLYTFYKWTVCILNDVNDKN